MSYLEGIGAWTRERLEERRETRSLAAALLEHGSRSVPIMDGLCEAAGETQHEQP